MQEQFDNFYDYLENEKNKDMNKFIFVNKGDTIYHAKLIDYEVVKEQDKKIYTQHKASKVTMLTENYLDVQMDNGETFFPCINNRAHTIITRVEGRTTHNIYSPSIKCLYDEITNLLRHKITTIREEENKLKNQELKIINMIEFMMEDSKNIEEVSVTAEEFATMAL